jgi:hypothetical protein
MSDNHARMLDINFHNQNFMDAISHSETSGLSRS